MSSVGPFDLSRVSYAKRAPCQRPYCGGQYITCIVVDKAGRSFKSAACLLCAFEPGGEKAQRQLKEKLDAMYPDYCKADLHPLTGDNLYILPSGHRGCAACREAKREARKIT